MINRLTKSLALWEFPNMIHALDVILVQNICNRFLQIIFCSATVAQDYDKFWVGETSEIVRVVERSQVPPNGISTTRRPVETTTPRFDRSTYRLQQNDDKIYDGCGDTKTCFGSPDNCVASKSCTTFSAILVRGNVNE